jgi:Zn-dependent protease/CBS domain-containing protein
MERPAARTTARKTDAPARGFRLGRIAGVNVTIDWSVLIIFALVVISLGSGYLPAAHGDWSAAVLWITAFAAGLLFFASILAHELSHAVVGNALGIPVRRITLFIFGGMAHMEGEAKKPMAELAMAIVGPLTSIGLGLVFGWIGVVLAGGNFEQLVMQDPEAAMRSIGPVASLFLWLGPVNILLGVFNVIPGFPLDGGRVLRAILWATTGSFERATRWATGIGRAIGYGFVLLGVLMALGWTVPFFGAGLISGLWIAMIGWFLASAARASYQQLVVKDLLEDVPVTKLMTRDFETVPADVSIAGFVERYVMHHDQRCFPVFAAESMVGLICIEDVRSVPRERWDTVRVADAMTPASDLTALTAEANANEALEELGRKHVDQLPVVQDGTLLGLIRKADILRWLTLHREMPTPA